MMQCGYQSPRPLERQGKGSRGMVESSVQGAASTAPPLVYTSYEGNSWGAELHNTGVKFLVDPWLVGTLTFGGLDFIYSGSKKVATPESIDVDSLVKETDFILITMSIDDHCHKPTLEVLPRNVPIVASPSAAAVVRKMGFTTVYELDHDETVSLLGDRITIQATEGALVGPPWSKRENGYVVKENVPGGMSLYYEPHADYNPASVAKVGQVDVVVSPPCTQSLLGYDLVKGTSENIPLLKMLKPKVVVPLMNAEFEGSGPLNTLITETGGPDMLKKQIQDDGGLGDVRICLPKAGQPCPVEW